MLKFGIVGTGMIANFHADAIKSLDDAKLCGVYDNVSDKAKAFAQKHNIKAYKSYEDMLTDCDLDAVCICTPSGFHKEQAMMALKHQKNVVVEKPMAFTYEDCRQIDEECKKSGCILTVISQFRFSDNVKKVKKLVSSNAFGKLIFCDLYMKYWRSPEYYNSSNWKGTKALEGGGALMNQGIHGVDLLTYIVGDAKVVNAKTKTVFHNIEVEDAAVAVLEFENGAMGVIEASTCAYPGFERRIEIIGTKGSVILKENTIEKLVIDGEDITRKNEAGDVIGTASDPSAMSYKFHAEQIQNFINAVDGKEKLLVGAADGARAVKIIENIYRY